MQEVGTDTRGLEGLDRRLGELLRGLPELKRATYEELGDRLLDAVQSRVGGAGKVQSWQSKFVGSGGGYAAVRPAAKQDDGHGYAVGAVTNAVTAGHKVRGPSGRAERYRPRLARTRVAGKQFYRDAQTDAERLAREAGERLAREIERRVGEAGE